MEFHLIFEGYDVEYVGKTTLHNVRHEMKNFSPSNICLPFVLSAQVFSPLIFPTLCTFFTTTFLPVFSFYSFMHRNQQHLVYLLVDDASIYKVCKSQVQVFGNRKSCLNII